MLTFCETPSVVESTRARVVLQESQNAQNPAAQVLQRRLDIVTLLVRCPGLSGLIEACKAGPDAQTSRIIEYGEPWYFEPSFTPQGGVRARLQAATLPELDDGIEWG
jgi:hypothetical protein